MFEVDAPPTGASFRGFLRSAGKLAVARQVSGLIFVGAVLALPNLTTHAAATEFVWAYFAMMTLTSLLGCGLERLAGTVVAERGSCSVGAALAPVLVARLCTLPLAAFSLWLMLTFVGVHLTAAAWVATFVWTVAGLTGPLVFGALRSAGNSSAEPLVMLGVRITQTAALVGLAASGAGVAIMVAVVAALEMLGVACGFRVVGPLRDLTRGTSVRALPLRRAGLLAGIEVIGLLNLRADLLLVGRMLGAGAGAVYGLLYRVVDGFSGVVGSAGLWLYAETANGNEGGTDEDGIRARSLRLLPRFGIALGLAVILLAGTVGSHVTAIAGHESTLRVLVIVFPLLTVNGIELHVRSGRGQNRQVLIVNAVAFAVNVGLCLWLLPIVGLVGGAIALAVSECTQAALLVATASPAERRLVTPSTGVAVLGMLTLGLTAIALNADRPLAVIAGVTTTLALIMVGLPVRGRLREVAP